ncbi:MAG TPA: response regulator transcription factor [Pseudonocardiaceae bacterium]|nr:response regulator transcription factor [Pseudonocardiaceae bacterium]
MGCARVLVVDDEPQVRDLLSTALRSSGFDVLAAPDGAQAVAAARSHPPDVLVLDVVLPDVDGRVLARRLRGAHDGVPVPVLFLTERGPAAERIAGLTAGGDEVVTKPFSVEDVVQRLQGILRRFAGDVTELRYADLVLDEDAHEARRAGRVLGLSPTEFALLRYLMANAEQVVSKAQIVDRVWSYDFKGDSRIVESYISYLRRKIDSGGEQLIHTVRGFGYSLREAR